MSELSSTIIYASLTLLPNIEPKSTQFSLRGWRSKKDKRPDTNIKKDKIWLNWPTPDLRNHPIIIPNYRRQCSDQGSSDFILIVTHFLHQINPGGHHTSPHFLNNPPSARAAEQWGFVWVRVFIDT